MYKHLKDHINMTLPVAPITRISFFCLLFFCFFLTTVLIYLSTTNCSMADAFFSLIFADVQIRHLRITPKEELKSVL